MLHTGCWARNCSYQRFGGKVSTQNMAAGSMCFSAVPHKSPPTLQHYQRERTRGKRRTKRRAWTGQVQRRGEESGAWRCGWGSVVGGWRGGNGDFQKLEPAPVLSIWKSMCRKSSCSRAVTVKGLWPQPCKHLHKWETSCTRVAHWP